MPVTATFGPTPHPRSDAELVLDACHGDTGAWEEIVDRHLPTVNRVARSYGLARQDREDAVQTVWLNLNRHLPRLRHPHLLGAWLRRVTRSECGRQRDRARGQVPVDPHRLAGWADHLLDVEDAYLRKERHAELHRAIDALGPTDRRIARQYLDDSPGAAPVSHRTTANERRNLFRRLRRSLAAPDRQKGVPDP
nr:sigma-70 family RNA polymerase sigma factor [Nocardiopsis sp. MG754419]